MGTLFRLGFSKLVVLLLLSASVMLKGECSLMEKEGFICATTAKQKAISVLERFIARSIWDSNLISRACLFRPAFFIRHFEKNSRTKKLKTQGKNSITQGQNSRLRQSSQICSTKTSLYYYFLGQIFWQNWNISENSSKKLSMFTSKLQNFLATQS